MSAHLPAKRPLAVTLTLWGVILFGVWNGGRAITLFLQLEILLNINIHLDPRIRLALACIWTIIFFCLAWALSKKKPFCRFGIPLALAGFGISDLLLQLFVPTAVASDWLLNGFFFVIILLLFYWALNNSRAKIFFAAYPHGEEDETQNKL